MTTVRLTPWFAVSLPLVLALAACSSGGTSSSAGNGGVGGGQNPSYTTRFPLTENPISQGVMWINGGTTGLDWGNVQTTPGLAFGTNVSGAPPYNDSTAVLTGTWASNQMVQATVYSINQTSSIQEEVELRLRTTITAHSITGYEFDYRVTSDGSQYLALVRWNGPLNNFTYLVNCGSGSGCNGPGLHNGDVVMATAIGNTLTGYINGVQVMQATDGTYTSGSPGMGFWNHGGTMADNSNYGFSSFAASNAASQSGKLLTDHLHTDRKRPNPFDGFRAKRSATNGIPRLENSRRQSVVSCDISTCSKNFRSKAAAQREPSCIL